MQPHILVWGGVGIVDPRVNYRPGAGSAVIYGFAPGNELLALDQVPSAMATTNIAAAQTTTSGTKLLSFTPTGAGIVDDHGDYHSTDWERCPIWGVGY